MKKIIAVLCLLNSMYACARNIDAESVSGNAAEHVPFIGTVNGNRVNVRSGPSVNFEVLAQMFADQTLTVLEEKQGWYRILPPDGVKYWVHGDFVDEGIINAYSVNVRSGPGINRSIAAQVEKGEPVTVLGIENEWVAIAPPEQAYAWVSSEFVDYRMPLSEYNKQAEEKHNQELKSKALQEKFDAAEQKERFELYKPLQEADLKSVIKDYQYIINEFPDTDKAKTAAERIARLQGLIASEEAAAAADKEQKPEPDAHIAGGEIPEANTEHNGLESAGLPGIDEFAESKSAEAESSDAGLLVFEGKPGRIRSCVSSSGQLQAGKKQKKSMRIAFRKYEYKQISLYECSRARNKNQFSELESACSAGCRNRSIIKD